MKNNKAGFWFLLSTLALGGLGSAAAPAQGVAARSFDHLYSGVGPQNFLGRSIQQTSDGGYIIAGVNVTTALNMELMKLDASGEVTWQNVYEVDGQYSDGFLAQQTTTGFIVVAVLGASNPNVLFVMSLDPDGDLLWEATYPTGGPIGALPSTIEQTPDGGYLLGATNFDIYDGVSPPLWVLKLNADGTIAWQNAYHMLGGSIHSTSDGGYIAAGYSLCEPMCQPWVAKLDAGGAITWQFQYELGASASAGSARQTADGGYLVGGGYDAASNVDDAWLMKLDADGKVRWQRGYADANCVHGGVGAYDAQAAAKGGYFLMLEDECSGSMLAKVDAQGAIQWVDLPAFASGGLVFLADWFAPTSDGGYAATGSVGSLALPPRLLALKADAQGGLRACSNVAMSGPPLGDVTPPSLEIVALRIGVEATAILPGSFTATVRPTQLTQENGCKL